MIDRRVDWRIIGSPSVLRTMVLIALSWGVSGEVTKRYVEYKMKSRPQEVAKNEFDEVMALISSQTKRNLQQDASAYTTRSPVSD